MPFIFIRAYACYLGAKNLLDGASDTLFMCAEVVAASNHLYASAEHASLSAPTNIDILT